MVQIALILIGLFVLIKGNLKVSDNKELTRPKSTYLGLVWIIGGLISGFIPLTLSVIFFVVLIAISVIFVAKGKAINSAGAVKKASDTKRNLIIFLVFIALLSAVVYFLSKSL